jgi:hypothetical protein
MSESTLPARRGQRKAAATASAAQGLTLSPQDIETESEQQLLSRGAAYVREYDRVKDAETTLLRNIAVVIVELRRRCDDWAGRTYKYRQLAGELYAQSGVELGRQSAVQAAVRYHIGNHLRLVLPPTELEALSLKPESPAERNKVGRQSRAAIVTMARHELTAAKVTEQVTKPKSAKSKPAAKAAKGAKPAPTAPPGPAPAAVADHIRLGQGARNILEQLSTDVIDGMTDGQRARLDDELAAVQDRVAELRQHTRKRSSDA